MYVKKSSWVNWRIDTCRLPNGSCIEDFHISEFPTGVGVVALTPDHKIIMIRQYRHGARKVLLEIPGGHLGPRDKTPLDAARRELREETGYSSRRWLPLGQMFLHPPSQENLIFVFLALNARRTANQKLDSTEDINVELMPFRQVLQIIQQKQMWSLGSTAAILLARDKVSPEA